MLDVLFRGRVLAAVVLSVLGVAASASAGPGNSFAVGALVSDGGVPAAAVDARLVNPWGLVAGPTSPWWTSNNASGTSTLYNGAGAKLPLAVTVDGGPTGIVFNGGATDFVVTSGAASAPARFVFASEDGRIRGWAATVPAAGSTATETMVDNSTRNALYKGLATAAPTGGTPRLYAADFHNARVDVFDNAWKPVASTGSFTDAKIPKGFAPFGIQAIGQRIFVTYAKQDAAAHDDVAGLRLGYVDAFDLDGKLLARVATKGPLDAPWGIAQAPAGFGKFGGDLLVGNFGDGRIGVYQEQPSGKWAYLGALRTPDQRIIAVDGLWALEFGNGAASGPTSTLYYTAGPQGEAHGLLGTIAAG